LQLCRLIYSLTWESAFSQTRQRRGFNHWGCSSCCFRATGLQLHGSAATGDRRHGLVSADRSQLIVSKLRGRHALNALGARGFEAQLIQTELLFDGRVDFGQRRRAGHFASWQTGRYGFKGWLNEPKFAGG
jgi:hypothetical protein